MTSVMACTPCASAAGAVPVEGGHGLRGRRDAAGAATPRLMAVAMMPVPSGLVSTSRSPGCAVALVIWAPGRDDARDGHTVLGLGVVDGVAPDDGHAGQPGHLGAPLEDAPPGTRAAAPPRGKPDDVQRECSGVAPMA